MTASPRKPLSPRRETFCQAYVCNPNASEAAYVAGYALGSCRHQGYRLLRIPAVVARIAEIRRRLAEDGCREIAVQLGKLENVYNRALKDGHYAAAARTVEIQARLAGLMPSVAQRLRALASAPPVHADDDK